MAPFQRFRYTWLNHQQLRSLGGWDARQYILGCIIKHYSYLRLHTQEFTIGNQRINVRILYSFVMYKYFIHPPSNLRRVPTSSEGKNAPKFIRPLRNLHSQSLARVKELFDTIGFGFDGGKHLQLFRFRLLEMRFRALAQVMQLHGAQIARRAFEAMRR